MNNLINTNKEVIAFYNSVKSRLETGDVIQNAINLAYGDLKRTLRGFSKCIKKEQIKKQIGVWLKFSYEDLINSPETYKNYDYWHKNVCQRMIDIFTEINLCDWQGLAMSTQSNVEPFCSAKVYLTIGQAQKWVNMFMKYMYICDERVEMLLPYLHIPIDNIILDGIEKYSSYFPLQNKVSQCRPWSKLDDYNAYYDFQIKFRELFPKPLLHEFRLWNKWNNARYERFEDLTEYIDYFNCTEQEFFYFPPDQMKEQYIKDNEILCIIAHPCYTQKCEEFFQILIHRYPVYNYLEVLHEKKFDLQDIENIDFECLDDFTILTLFTSFMRMMHFGNEVIFGELACKGIICKMLLRLQKIDNSEHNS